MTYTTWYCVVPARQRLACLFLSVVGLLTDVESDEVLAGPDVTCSARPNGSLSSDGEPSASAVTLAGVPAYRVYHGCGPTSAASILGYWDLNGYPNLFDASGSEVFLTSKVQDQISSPAHNRKYDPKPDLPGPEPVYTSIADWYGTSAGRLGRGLSYVHKADDAIEGYAKFRGYEFEATNLRPNSSSPLANFGWDELTAAIDDRQPVLLHVDTHGDGRMDHSIPAFGYDDRGLDGKYYAFYTSWSEREEEIVWRRFQAITSESPWSIGVATVIAPIDSPIPEPTCNALWMLVLGVVVRKTRGSCPGSAIRLQLTSE